MKSLKNLGMVLTKAEQKTINGGRKHCVNHEQCGPGRCCQFQPPFSSGLTSGFCGAVNNGNGLCNGELPLG